jgi:hypothetical protein
MAEEIHHTDGRIEHPSVRHERSDASFRWILGLILGAMAFAAVVQYLLLVFVYDYAGYEDKAKQSPYPLAPGPSTKLPHEPRLEQLDRTAGVESPDVYKRDAAKEDILNRYGRLEGTEEFVHIPIDQAITLALREDYLPVRPAPPAGQRSRENGLVNAGASNSGRIFREKP